MQNTKHMLLALAAVAVMVAAIPVRAQQQPPANRQQAQPTVTQGELTRVDATAKTLSIRTAQGADMQFRYTEETKIVGADKGVAGLATMTGSEDRVSHTKQGDDNVASQIEVLPKEKK
jgi:hypothetical protein